MEAIEKLAGRARRVNRWLELEYAPPDAPHAWYARLYGGRPSCWHAPICGECGAPHSYDDVSEGDTLAECLDKLDGVLTAIETQCAQEVKECLDDIQERLDGNGG